MCEQIICLCLQYFCSHSYWMLTTFMIEFKGLVKSFLKPFSHMQPWYYQDNVRGARLGNLLTWLITLLPKWWRGITRESPAEQSSSLNHTYGSPGLSQDNSGFFASVNGVCCFPTSMRCCLIAFCFLRMNTTSSGLALHRTKSYSKIIYLITSKN